MGRTVIVLLLFFTGSGAAAGSGDVNNDGCIRLNDAVLAAGIAGGAVRATSEQRARADVLPLTSETGDGIVSASDARFLFRVAAGFEEDPAWLTVPLFGYLLCDDDGSRCADITPEQVRAWVDYANTAYLPARIRLTFDPADLVTLHSSLLNNMGGVGGADWERQRAEANRLAAERYGFITVFFRHGPGAGPTGGGFSWSDLNFAGIPGFDITTVCGHQNRGLLAHELGHYLGLSHTFAREFGTVTEAQEYLGASGGNLDVFNGDDIADTPPDPFIREIQCDDSESVVLSGQAVPLARDNLMSYWEVPNRSLTPEQCRRIRWMLQTRARNGMAAPTNAGIASAIEADTLDVSSARGVSLVRQEMSGWGAGLWNEGDQLFCGARNGGQVTLKFDISEAGAYSLDVWLTQAPDFGIVRFRLDGREAGDTFDAWAYRVMPSGRIPLGRHTLSAGSHKVRFEVVSRNPLSTGYLFGIDCLTLEPSSVG